MTTDLKTDKTRFGALIFFKREEARIDARSGLKRFPAKKVFS